MEHRLAVDDEEYSSNPPDKDWWEEEEEDENPWPEEDFYDFPSTEDDGPWYDPQDGKY